MNNQETYVFEPCPIPDSIDIDLLKTQVHEYMEPRKRFYRETERNLSIEDEFSEWWIANASKGIQIGKGSSGMDVKTSKNEGIDVMCVILEGTLSNEKSLMQNFTDSGSNLDTLFNEKDDIKAVQLFRDNYYNKIYKTKQDKGLNDLYILAFISNKQDIYIICFKLTIGNIQNICSGGFIENTKSCVNIKVDRFINSQFGNVKLYKSKKRMELRLTKNIIHHPNAIKVYSLINVPHEAMEQCDSR